MYLGAKQQIDVCGKFSWQALQLIVILWTLPLLRDMLRCLTNDKLSFYYDYYSNNSLVFHFTPSISYVTTDISRLLWLE